MSAALLSSQQILERITAKVENNVADQVASILRDTLPDEIRSQNAKNWLSWAQHQGRNLRVTEISVPGVISSADVQLTLNDVRIQCKGPDDKIYDRNAQFRERVARGNCILEISDKSTNETSADCVIFALKKFTGGLGDDDDRDIRDGFKFEKYFAKPITEAERVVCTRKMNGEAAHFAVRWLNGQFYIIAGPKNVHLLFRNVEELELYSESRYEVAREVARTCYSFFETMNADDRNALFSFFHITKLTAVLEILQPHYQHIEDLSYLPASKLVFISWSKTDLQPGIYENETCIRPDVGQQIARAFGLATTGYDVVSHEELQERLLKIRRGHGYEGEVLYFLDAKGSVIGLLKKKTIWYIIVRAIREKTKGGTSRMRKGAGEKFDCSEVQSKTRKRLREIQKWLDLDKEAIAQWQDLADGFFAWLALASKNGKVDVKDIFGLYPVIWTRYLKDTGKSDAVGVQHITEADDPDHPDASAVPEAPNDDGAGGDAQEDSN